MWFFSKTPEIYNLKIFEWIDDDTVDSIIKNCSEETYQSWEIIMAQGEESNWKGYIIKSGKVQITVNGTKMSELDSGNIVWEIALLNEEERTATVQAVEKTTMIVLSIEELIEMINNWVNHISKWIMQRIEQNISAE